MKLKDTIKKLEKHLYLIYADDYITWNEEKNDWNHSAKITGTYLDAHEHARSLFGKKYTLKLIKNE